MSHCLVLDAGDQYRSEQNASHLSVEEVYSVVRLRHQGGLISAGHIVLHALITHTQENRVALLYYRYLFVCFYNRCSVVQTF